MSPARAYLLLTVLGLVLPYTQFVPWLLDHGLDPQGFLLQMFANRIAAFFALDVIVAAGALLVFVIIEGRRLGVRHLWAPVLGTLLVGVSFGLPLFLYLRESVSDSRSPRASATG